MGELLKEEDEKLQLDMKVKDIKKVKDENCKNALKEFSKESKKEFKPRKQESKRRIVALEEIMEEEIKKKRLKELSDPAMENAWLQQDIVVKIMTKSLGDRYYKKKGRVVEVIDDFAALVQLKDVTAKVRVDQDDLETVIPNVGRTVMILWGKYGGEEAELTRIDTKKFQAELKLSS